MPSMQVRMAQNLLHLGLQLVNENSRCLCLLFESNMGQKGTETTYKITSIDIFFSKMGELEIWNTKATTSNQQGRNASSFVGQGKYLQCHVFFWPDLGEVDEYNFEIMGMNFFRTEKCNLVLLLSSYPKPSVVLSWS